jgi:hypothetical protein
MEKNLGMADRLARGAVCAAIIGLYLTGILSIDLIVIFGIVVLDLAVTAILGFDQIYGVFGLTTAKRKDSLVVSKLSVVSGAAVRRIGRHRMTRAQPEKVSGRDFEYSEKVGGR